MKMAWKIFCMAYLIVMLTVGVGGFGLVELTAASITENRVESVLTSNEYAGKMLFALAEQSPASSLRKNQIQNQVARMVNTAQTDRLTVCLLEETAGYDTAAFVNGLSASQQSYAFIEVNGVPFLQAVCRIDLSDERYYVETLSDFSDIVSQRERLVRFYRYTVLGIALLSGGALLCFSLYVTHPLKRLSHAANQIAAGDYQKRIPIKAHGMGSEEIAKLSADFNRMAAAVEKNVGGLTAEIEKREAFVADFTHELKTPMTSIIGYADLLRSYELTEEERRQTADAIYREGRRLEALSMKLLELIVLKNETITLQRLDVGALFDRFRESLRFLEQKYGVTVGFEIEPAAVRAEPTLLLSLLYNLADNACRASATGGTVTIAGENRGGQYLVSVADHGCGISKKNLDRITEPFFMEDKSRSRKQGGAGLGLALCKQIAALHQTALTFDSAVGIGTTVTFALLTEPEEGEELSL